MNLLLLLALLTQTEQPAAIAANPELFPADRPILVPVWNRVADFSPTLRSVEAAEFSPDGRLAISGSKFGGDVMLWRVADGYLFWQRSHESEVECVCFSPDGRLVASGGEDFTVRIWDVVGGKAVRVIELPRGIDGIAWSHDGDTLAAGDEEGRLHLIDTSGSVTEWAVRAAYPTGSTINSLAFTRDDSRLAVAGNLQTKRQDGKGTDYLGFARLLDAGTGQTITDYGPIGAIVNATSGMRTGSIKSIQFSPDESLVACGGFGSETYVFETESGTPVKTLAEPRRIEAVAFSPEGHYLVTGGHASALRFYRTTDWSLAHEHPAVRCEYIDFTRDGRLMLTGHEDSGLLSLHLLASDLQRQIDGRTYHRLADQNLKNRDLKTENSDDDE